MEENILQQILTTVQAIQSEVHELNNRVDKLDTRMEKLETRMEKLETRMDKLETRLDNVESRLGKLETRIDSLENGQNELNQMVRAIRDRGEETDEKLEVGPHHEKVEEVNNKLVNIYEDQLSIKHIIGEHMVSIRTLKRRAL